MTPIPPWIESISASTLDPARVANALASIVQVWPANLPPLDEWIASFPAGMERLLTLLAVSPVSGVKLVRDPEALLWLSDPEVFAADRGPRRMRADLEWLKRSAAKAFDPSFATLRRLKAREMLRIALREFGGWSALEQTTAELTCLAELCLQEVYSAWAGELGRRFGRPETDFAVLGMGKFGGRELNYSSDIDVIFLYEEEGMLNERLSYSDFFQRLCEKIVTTFARADPAGSLFRIDLRLRPEGDSGPLVRSLGSMENYYAGFGETWERMALIKARGVCGSDALAYEFSQRLQPFIFPRAVSADLLEEIREIKSRIERDIVGPDRMTRNVKLGYGGIREIEFVVQTLQLLHGARNAFLQGNNTLKTLEGLRELGLLDPPDAAALADACRFLRRVEHRLQIENEAQTHTLPESEEDLDRIAATLGFSGRGPFLAELARQTSAVREVFNKVLRARRAEAEGALDLSLFEDPAQAGKELQRLREGTSGSVHVSPRARKLFAKLEPLLLRGLGGVADPDAALSRFAGFVERYGIRGLLFETLVVNPRLLELLLRLFDSSPFLTSIVQRRPQLIEEVARGGLLDRRMTVQDYLSGLARNEERIEWADWARVYRRSQILRIFLRDVLGLGNVSDVHAEYSALAEACVIYVLRSLAVEESLTVVAMGKFGGRELSYGCDLDVVFAGGESEHAATFVKAMTTITAEGLVFPIDVRLRPEGRAGLLTLPVEGYARYFEQRAQAWEAQALTKARPISGPEAGAFLDMAQSAWRRFAQRPQLFDEIRAMHARVVKERAPGPDNLNFKTGRGGLMALEFTVQGVQMKCGVWEQNTVAAIGALRKRGIIGATDASALVEHYYFLRRIEAVIRRVENAGGSVLPREEAEQRKVAKRLGFKDREEFAAAYSAAREDVARLFVQFLGTGTSPTGVGALP